MGKNLMRKFSKLAVNSAKTEFSKLLVNFSKLGKVSICYQDIKKFTC